MLAVAILEFRVVVASIVRTKRRVHVPTVALDPDSNSAIVANLVPVDLSIVAKSDKVVAVRLLQLIVKLVKVVFGSHLILIHS